MLRRLSIEDFGLIARAQIEFAAGATMFTGETGSGKTMVLGALTFALGERGSSDAVRRGRSRAVVTLEFEPSAAMREKLAADGFEIDPDEDATVVREMSESGKSALRLNGRPATASYIRQISGDVVDVVGQHEAQHLLQPAFHVDLLDRFGGEKALQARERVAETFEQRAEIESAIRDFDRDERRAQEQFAFAKFALDEIQSAAPEQEEDQRLTQRRRVLDNAEKLATALRGAHESLIGETGASDALGAAASALQHIVSVGPEFEGEAQTVSALQSEVNELAVSISRQLDSLEFDPSELEVINARLDALDTLKRKYGGTLEAVQQSAEEFSRTMELAADQSERKLQLENNLRRLSDELETAAERLSELRHDAAKRLRKALEPEMKDLALPSARFDVRFEALERTGPGGRESVEFVFAANKGEAERPLARVASGGELSRVLLALVVVLTGAAVRTSLVFDEIDTGIGGATANAVGIRLGRLARQGQVICVTHLAQIAAWAQTHYVLEKREDSRSATIEVRVVDNDREKTAELARMLSGETRDVALQHARTLLEQTHERRTALASS